MIKRLGKLIKNLSARLDANKRAEITYKGLDMHNITNRFNFEQVPTPEIVNLVNAKLREKEESNVIVETQNVHEVFVPILNWIGNCHGSK